MNTVHKVFTVITFVLSLVYLVSTGVLFSNIQNYKKALETTEDELQKTKQEMKATIEAKDQDINDKIRIISEKDEALHDEGMKYKALAASKEKLNIELTETRRDLQKIEEGLKESILTVEKQRNEIESKDNELKQLEAKLADAKTVKEEVEDKNVELTDLKNTLESQLAQLHKDYSATSQELKDKNMVLAKLVSYGIPVYDIFVFQGPATPIHGKVLAVDADENVVVISVGEDDGVKKGFQFTVYRGDSYIGKIQVEKVMPNMASARVLRDLSKPGQTVQGGDNVSTDVYSR